MSAFEKLQVASFAESGSMHKGINTEELFFLSNCRPGFGSDISTIHFYNCKNKTWNKYDHSPPNVHFHTASLDEKNKILYVNDGLSNVYKIDLQNHQNEMIGSIINGQRSSSMVIDGKFHIFIQARSFAKHMIWDNNTNTFRSQSNPPYFSGSIGGECSHFCYIPSINCILKIGGIKQTKVHDRIYSYNCSTSSWSKLNITFPIPIYASHSIPCDNRFLIIFGVSSSNGAIRDIFVFDSQTMQVKKSKIKMPFFGQCQMVIPKSNKRNKNVILSGYVRNAWKNDSFNELIYPPLYLVDLMTTYYSNGYAYLMDTGFHVSTQDITRFYRIKVDSIFDCFH
eukprot:439615_1